MKVHDEGQFSQKENVEVFRNLVTPKTVENLKKKFEPMKTDIKKKTQKENSNNKVNLIVKNIEKNSKSAAPFPPPIAAKTKFKPCNLCEENTDDCCTREMKDDCGEIEGLVISIGGRMITTGKKKEGGFTTRNSHGEGGSSVKKKTKFKKIGTPKIIKTSNLEGKRLFFDRYMRTGGNRPTYGGTISTTISNLNPQECCDFRGNLTSQSGELFQTGPRQEDSWLIKEGGDWPEGRPVGSIGRMGEELTDKGGGE